MVLQNLSVTDADKGVPSNRQQENGRASRSFPRPPGVQAPSLAGSSRRRYDRKCKPENPRHQINIYTTYIIYSVIYNIPGIQVLYIYMSILLFYCLRPARVVNQTKYLTQHSPPALERRDIQVDRIYGVDVQTNNWLTGSNFWGPRESIFQGSTWVKFSS